MGDRAGRVGQRAHDNFGLICSASGGCLAILAAGGAEHGGSTVERKLAAIFAADIAGYTRLMSHDEVGTLARLKAFRVIIDGLIATHRGRIFNTAGDSVIPDFASAVDAVACAVAVQNAISTEEPGGAAGEPMRFRIGVHVGDDVPKFQQM